MRRGADHGRRLRHRRGVRAPLPGRRLQRGRARPRRRPRSRRARAEVDAYAATSTDADALAAAVDEAAAALGGLDVVVAAAGIAARGTVADTDPADWDRVLAVNLRGVYLTGRAAIPHLRAAGGGAIVNIASQLGLVAAAGAAAYCASKGARHLAHARDGDRSRRTRASASTASARGRPTRRCSSRTSAARPTRRPSARPTRRCSYTRASSRPRRSPARWPTSPRPARARRWAPRSSSMGGTSSDDRPSGRRQRRDRHAGRSLARLGRARGALARARAARVRAHRGGAARLRLARRGRPRRASTPRPAARRTSSRVDIDLHLEFYEAGIGEVTARDRYAGMLVGKHLAGIYRRRYGTQAALTHEARAGRPGQDRRVRRRASRSASSRCSASSASPTRSSGATTCCCRSSTGSRCGSARAIPPGTGSMQIALPDGGELAVTPTADGCSLQPVSVREPSRWRSPSRCGSCR